MKCVTRPRITELNPHLLCVLCGGYYIDATAIIECLHSFCKSCIIRYLETHKYCPICDVLVHKTKPLQNLRPDTILQNLVYKLVPNLYDREMGLRRNYYLNVHPSLRPSDLEERGELTESSSFYSSADTISFSLEYVNYFGAQNYFYVAPASTRYFRSQAVVTIDNLRTLIAAKYTLSEESEVNFFYNEIQLPEHLSLLDIAYMSSWKRRGYIRILYQILEVKKILVKNEKKSSATSVTIPKTTIPPNILELKHTVKSSVLFSDDEKKLELKVEPESTEATSTFGDNTNVPNVKKNTTNTTNLDTGVTTSCNIIVSEPKSVDSVSKPLTTPICEAKVNGLSSDTKTSSKKTESANVKNDTVSDILKPCSVDENKKVNQYQLSITTNREMDSDKEKTARMIQIKSNDSTKAPAMPPKLPKLEIIRVETTESERKRKSDDVPTIRSIPKLQKIVTTAASITPFSLSITVTSSPLSSSGQQISSKVISEVSKYQCVQKGSPRPIYTRSEPTIMKSTTKVMKGFTRPWSSPSTTSPSTFSITSDVANKDRSKPMKIFKAKDTPRFFGNIASGIRPTIVSSGQRVKNDNMKKSVKSLSVTKIDPKTLSPIASTSTSSCSVASNVSNKSFPYLPSTCSLSPANLATYTTSPTLGPKSVNSFLYPPLALPMDPRRLYPPALESLEHMMAVSTLNLCSQFFTAPLHPSLNQLYSTLPKSTKIEKTIRGKNSKTPPPVQRISVVSNETLSIEYKVDNCTSKGVKRETVSNGQLKNKSKKSPEVSKFSINNLIPLDDLKHASHSCSADGVNQICDQIPPGLNKVGENVKGVKEFENKEEKKRES